MVDCRHAGGRHAGGLRAVMARRSHCIPGVWSSLWQCMLTLSARFHAVIESATFLSHLASCGSLGHVLVLGPGHLWSLCVCTVWLVTARFSLAIDRTVLVRLDRGFLDLVYLWDKRCPFAQGVPGFCQHAHAQLDVSDSPMSSSVSNTVPQHKLASDFCQLCLCWLRTLHHLKQEVSKILKRLA